MQEQGRDQRIGNHGLCIRERIAGRGLAEFLNR
jgi:hypothetical protein